MKFVISHQSFDHSEQQGKGVFIGMNWSTPWSSYQIGDNFENARSAQEIRNRVFLHTTKKPPNCVYLINSVPFWIFLIS
jgi:hypothetical protein